MPQNSRRNLDLTPTSSKDLREEARVTPTSIDRAREEWREVGKGQLVNLPDAVEE